MDLVVVPDHDVVFVLNGAFFGDRRAVVWALVRAVARGVQFGILSNYHAIFYPYLFVLEGFGSEFAIGFILNL